MRTEEEKQYAKRLALDTLKPHIQKNYKKLSNDLVYFNCFIEDKAIDIRLIDREQIVGLCHNLIYDLKESTKKNYLFSVLHLDQTDSEAHIHSIIIN